MNYTLNNIVVFAAGAAVGCFVTWRYLKAEYIQRTDEQIREVKDYYLKRFGEPNKPEVMEETEVHVATPDPTLNIREYASELAGQGYTTYANIEAEQTPLCPAPYVIMPSEYGTEEDYDEISLTLFVDGVLTDELGEPIEDVEGAVGLDYVNHFGEYEDDTVFIRNERLMTDYEIQRDERKYSDIANRNRHPWEDE